MKYLILMTIRSSLAVLFTFFYLTDIFIVYAAINIGEPNPDQSNPYTKLEGVPKIVIINNNNNTYQGALRVFNLVSGDVNNNMPVTESNPNISSILPENAINVSQNDQIQLLVRGNPESELQPNSLSATVYFGNGTAFKILSLAESAKKDTFLVDIPKGEYILLATSTWLPNPNNYLTTSGYITYAFRLDVI
jgi:hypothetical protein